MTLAFLINNKLLVFLSRDHGLNDAREHHLDPLPDSLHLWRSEIVYNGKGTGERVKGESKNTSLPLFLKS